MRFNKMQLIAKKCIVQSSKECNTWVQLGKHVFRSPVIPCNKHVGLDSTSAFNLAFNNYLYVLPREEPEVLALALSLHEMNMLFAKNIPMSVSVGVSDEDRVRLLELHTKHVLPDFITIDVDQGHSTDMEKMVRWIKKSFPKKQPYVIAGQVLTGEAVADLESWGADAVTVNIGSECSLQTKQRTGFGSRDQVSLIEECLKAKNKSSTQLITVGGIDCPGDIAKALTLGVDCVIVCKSFLETSTPLQEMNYVEDCLQQSISYAGGKTLDAFRDVEF